MAEETTPDCLGNTDGRAETIIEFAASELDEQPGINHFGFEVEDVVATREACKDLKRRHRR